MGEITSVIYLIGLSSDSLASPDLLLAWFANFVTKNVTCPGGNRTKLCLCRWWKCLLLERYS